MTAVDENCRKNLLISGAIETDGIHIAWNEAPWDSAVYGFPVLQVTCIEKRGPSALKDLEAFERARDFYTCGLVSCRIPCEKLEESILLERIGFRFIEMVYQPEIGDLQSQWPSNKLDLDVIQATNADLSKITNIAGSSFRNERLHVDPRLPQHLSDKRYQQWVLNSLSHPTQKLYILQENGSAISFFVTENLADGTCYWHLNAVDPEAQGKGYGRRSWQTMLTHARMEGAQRVRSSITARNHRVLNLYARLGFHFPRPMMTFHWVRLE